MGEAYRGVAKGVAMVGFMDESQAKAFAELSGGTVIRPRPEDYHPEKQDADSAPLGAVAVAFSPDLIPALVERLGSTR